MQDRKLSVWGNSNRTLKTSMIIELNKIEKKEANKSLKPSFFKPINSRGRFRMKTVVPIGKSGKKWFIICEIPVKPPIARLLDWKNATKENEYIKQPKNIVR